MVYWRLVDELGKALSDCRLAKEARVGRMFAGKVRREIQEGGAIRTVEELKEERWLTRKKGVGSHCLTLREQLYLLQLRADNPTRSNDSYIAHLFFLSGNKVSSNFISTFFKKIGPFDASFKKLSTIPVDKYKPSNIVT